MENETTPTRRLLVTGATGFLGRVVAREAQAMWTVMPASSAQFDLRAGTDVDGWIERVAPDAIVHTAAIMGGADLALVTSIAPGQLAMAAARRGLPFVHVSSDAVFAGDRAHPYTEHDDPAPVHAYGRAKAAAEAFVRSAYPGAVVVRTSLLFGLPTEAIGKHEQTIIDAAKGTRDFTFYEDEIRCPAHVLDVSKVILALVDLVMADRFHGGVLHAAGAEAMSRFAFARAVAMARGLDPNRLRRGSALDLAAGSDPRPRCVVLDSSVVADLVPTRLRGVRETLGL